jgi:hypothetical protein
MEPVVVDPADTLTGQLQRGRGAGALWAARLPSDARAIVMDCVCRDPRWDHDVEDRAFYYAQLIRDHAWPIDVLEQHLSSPADAVDPDNWRTSLTLQVLGLLSQSSYRNAVALLSRYATEGSNWVLAVDELAENGSAHVVIALADEVLGRLTDAELADEVEHEFGPWDILANTQPRVAEALRQQDDQFARAHVPVSPEIDPASLSAADLVERVRGAGRPGREAALELGRRADPVLLDLTEEYIGQPGGPGSAALSALRKFATDEVLTRARQWVRDGSDRAEVGVWILAESGDASDAPVILADLESCLAEQEWGGAVAPVEAVGRLGLTAAAPLAIRAWNESAYSYLRPRVLTSLITIQPETAAVFATEGLWDCEELTRQRSAEFVRKPHELRTGQGLAGAT